MVELRHSRSHVPTMGTPEANGSDDAQLDIVHLFRIPDRYLRSVHLERDFDDSPVARPLRPDASDAGVVLSGSGGPSTWVGKPSMESYG